LTHLWLKPKHYHTRGEHANHYTINTVKFELTNQKHCYRHLIFICDCIKIEDSCFYINKRINNSSKLLHIVSVTQSASQLKKIAEVSITLFSIVSNIQFEDLILLKIPRLAWAIVKLKWPKVCLFHSDVTIENVIERLTMENKFIFEMSYLWKQKQKNLCTVNNIDQLLSHSGYKK
jgi:hypothetical protein